MEQLDGEIIFLYIFLKIIEENINHFKSETWDRKDTEKTMIMVVNKLFDKKNIISRIFYGTK